ncbi:MAG: PD40 domain-containing protein, partial [Gemmatimonadetes bacterium]|nr:PD40 domain-containing protein [Gemmatimonadota bacterium]
PAWSPDGTKIAYTRSGTGGHPQIYVMNADGSNQTNLSNNAANDAKPTWSPGGTKVAFHSTRDGNTEIYVMNADGSSQTRLTTTSASDEGPSWR